jgi:hypothetical protein
LTPVSTEDPVVSVVVGDDPWDFAIAYALRRNTSLAWWIPRSLANNRSALARLALRVRTLGQDASEGVVLSDKCLAVTAFKLKQVRDKPML